MNDFLKRAAHAIFRAAEGSPADLLALYADIPNWGLTSDEEESAYAILSESCKHLPI